VPDWIRFPLVLTIVAVISASALAGLQHVTKPVKERIQKGITEQALKVVMPKADSFEEVDATVDGKPFAYRIAKGADGQSVGYVAIGAAEGYSSKIKVMVGATPEFEIAAIKVLYQKETPGLGDKIEEILSKKTWGTVITGTSPDESNLRPWFQTQFDGKSVPVKVDKDGGAIEAITGATISSRAVCDAVDEAVENLKKAISPKEEA
jgi:electron transport complex protein RnfG